MSLNGANTDLEPGAPRMTMESLVYVRIVEEAFHDLITEEYKAKRKKKGLPAINFDRPGPRKRHRWFDDFYKDVKKQHDGQYIDALHGFGASPGAAAP
jgi:hypothetical protein